MNFLNSFPNLTFRTSELKNNNNNNNGSVLFYRSYSNQTMRFTFKATKVSAR